MREFLHVFPLINIFSLASSSSSSIATGLKSCQSYSLTSVSIRVRLTLIVKSYVAAKTEYVLLGR